MNNKNCSNLVNVISSIQNGKINDLILRKQGLLSFYLKTYPIIQCILEFEEKYNNKEISDKEALLLLDLGKVLYEKTIVKRKWVDEQYTVEFFCFLSNVTVEESKINTVLEKLEIEAQKNEDESEKNEDIILKFMRREITLREDLANLHIYLSWYAIHLQKLVVLSEKIMRTNNLNSGVNDVGFVKLWNDESYIFDEEKNDYKILGIEEKTNETKVRYSPNSFLIKMINQISIGSVNQLMKTLLEESLGSKSFPYDLEKISEVNLEQDKENSNILIKIKWVNDKKFSIEEQALYIKNFHISFNIMMKRFKEIMVENIYNVIAQSIETPDSWGKINIGNLSEYFKKNFLVCENELREYKLLTAMNLEKTKKANPIRKI